MKNFFIKSLNGMAFGLFSSLIVGLILKQIGTLFNIEFLTYLGGFSQLLMGAGIGVGVAYALESHVLILIASAITGMYGAGSINFVDGQAVLKVG
ncbi:MAG: PTS sugar transporter subunit IIC, partial [Fusobacterium periodonticum]|nr:PTS sugar transporter subunit IIC [Fusobacterium periodonticum]